MVEVESIHGKLKSSITFKSWFYTESHITQHFPSLLFCLTTVWLLNTPILLPGNAVARQPSAVAKQSPNDNSYWCNPFCLVVYASLVYLCRMKATELQMWVTVSVWGYWFWANKQLHETLHNFNLTWKTLRTNMWNYSILYTILWKIVWFKKQISDIYPKTEDGKCTSLTLWRLSCQTLTDLGQSNEYLICVLLNCAPKSAGKKNYSF